MIEFIQKIWLSLISCLQNIQDFLDHLLQNLDPALFQNIILGIIALLIPVAVAILSFFFEERSKEKIYSNLELFVLVKKVLNSDRFVIYSLLGLFLFACFSVSLFVKIFAILFFVFYVIWVFLVPFKNIWKWMFESTKEFSIDFLKSLNIKKDKNIILDSWKALWLGHGKNLKLSESDFTKVFIQHIDDAIKFKKFDLAVELAQIYINNIEKRDRIFIGNDILPKILEWHEIFWNEKKSLHKHDDTEKKKQKHFLSKFFLRFGDLMTKLYKKQNSKKEYFWNWHNFGGDFFKAIIKILMKNDLGPYQLFESFKKHIEKSERKLEKITDEKEKERYWDYITGLFSSFCPTFFNEINSAPSNYEIWEDYFPPEWKITIANKDNRMAHIILREFLRWSTDRIFKKENKENLDKDLTKVINGIFPNVHSSLFTAFLMLYFSVEIKDAIEKEANFYIYGVGVSWSGSVEESKEEIDKRLAEMMKVREISQKEETIQIIFKFFHCWKILKIYKDDLSEDESKNWQSYTEEERKLVIKKVRKEKLEKTKAEIESEEIKKICEGSERKKFYREVFLELIKLLILEIEK
jgi:biotin-(acetyl-CoA carboxylase) ligase